MTKFQRVYEAAILRTLGASTRLLGTMLALEYSALGLIAGLIGAAGSLALSWAVCRYVFEIDWEPAPVLLTAGALATTALVGIIGVVASADVLRKKPLATPQGGVTSSQSHSGKATTSRRLRSRGQSAWFSTK